MTQTAYIGIGSNLGEKLANCLKAVSLVDQIPGCRVTARSEFFSTAPVGVEGQDWYVNSAISVETDISARQLLERLLAIETDLGRIRIKKWDSRPIDLDILLFGNEIIDEKDLIIPHPFMHLRKFVLAPLALIAPDVIHPVFKVSVKKLLDGLRGDDHSVILLKET